MVKGICKIEGSLVQFFCDVKHMGMVFRSSLLLGTNLPTQNEINVMHWILIEPILQIKKQKFCR